MHIPVLPKEVIQYLKPEPNENFIDCTIGQGGHALSILEKNKPRGNVLGIDQDENQIENSKLKIKQYQERIILVCGNSANLKKIVEEYKFEPVAGILLDLGMSSWHLEGSERGFTFQKNEPLDMRFDTKTELTAKKIINEWSASEIERILKEYGEEKFAQRISRDIAETRKIRPIKNTLELAQLIEKIIPGQNKHKAVKVFQALRIAVNDELKNLERVLPQAVEILSKKGRLVVISFHSLEDRIVKNFFRESARNKIVNILTKKPIIAGSEELKTNSRSRSAKLRAVIKN